MGGFTFVGVGVCGVICVGVCWFIRVGVCVGACGFIRVGVCVSVGVSVCGYECLLVSMCMRMYV